MSTLLKIKEYSHMPFLGYANNEPNKELCCLKINGTWKVHYFDNGIWRKLATYTNADAQECCPTTEFIPSVKKWRTSFIAGGSIANDWEDVGFYLYIKWDFDDSQPIRMMPANVGFVWKNQITIGYKDTPEIYQYEDGIKTTIKLNEIDYVYRLNYDINQPDKLLISAQRKNGDLVTFTYVPNEANIYLIKDGEEPVYKWCTSIDNEIYYCLKGKDDGFEDRHIVKAGNLKMKRYNRAIFIKEIKQEPTDFATQNFGEI